MVTYQAPGVYVEEVPLTPSIAGVGTSTAGFIGVSDGTAPMPDQPDGTPYPIAAINEPVLVTSFDQFKRSFGDFAAGNNVLAHSVYGFFNNGGSACWVARAADIDDVPPKSGPCWASSRRSTRSPWSPCPGLWIGRAAGRHRALRRREPAGPVRHPRRPADHHHHRGRDQGRRERAGHRRLRRSLLSLRQGLRPGADGRRASNSRPAGWSPESTPGSTPPAVCTRLRPTRAARGGRAWRTRPPRPSRP